MAAGTVGVAVGLLGLLLGLDTAGPALSRATGLPVITVQLLAGVAARAAELLPRSALDAEAPLHLAALGVITVAAGAELEAGALRSNRRLICCLAVSLTIAAVIVVSATSYALVLRAPSLGVPLPPETRAAGSVLAAVVAVARSPSAAIALISEMGADGPFTRTLLGVTMVSKTQRSIYFYLCYSSLAFPSPYRSYGTISL
jgi:NhaP-type Na+/H+ or K+/H+ antiporter